MIDLNFYYESHYQASDVEASRLRLQIEILTWDKDSHGLFDYESTKNAKENF